MEDRKKSVRELEIKNRESRIVLDGLLENLGESLLNRLTAEDIAKLSLSSAEGDSPRTLLEEKRRLQKEISSSEVTMKRIEDDVSRLKEMEEEIYRKEWEKTEKTKELAPIYLELGRLILETPDYEEYSAPYKKQLEELFLQIDFQEKRLEELENSEGNFITRLANGARGVFTKSLLAKNEASQEGIYRSAGELFIFSPEESLSEGSSSRSPAKKEIITLVKRREEIHKKMDSLEHEIKQLNNDHLKIEDALDIGGSPLRRIAALKKYIANNQEETRKIYYRFGLCTRIRDRRKKFLSLFNKNEKTLEEKIDSVEDSVIELEKRIEALKIAISIEKENSDIDKIKKTIYGQRQRIAEAESNITELEGRITEAQVRIDDLSKLLQDLPD